MNVRHHLQIIGFVTVALMGSLDVSVAVAQTRAQASDNATSAAKKRARAAYARGQELYQAGKYEEAEVYFNRAYEAVPNPVVLLSIAETLRKLDRGPEAVSSLETYLQMRPDATNRDEIEQKIAEIRNLPAKVDITSDPPGAEILIDGVGTGKLTPSSLEIEAGEHTIGLSLAGKGPLRQVITLQFGTHRELQLALQDEESPSLAAKPLDFPAASEEPAPEETGIQSPGVAAWAVAGVGVAALATGAVLGTMALGEKNDFDDNPTKKTADRGERLALFADVAFGVGALAIVTGVVLWLTQPNTQESADTAHHDLRAAKRWTFVPAVSPNYAGVLTRLRY
jgi:hypothetical protein